MYEIEVEDRFTASHFLKLYDGSWETRHEHAWKVSVVLRAPKLDAMEVVADFEAVKPCLRHILSEFENSCVNDHPAFKDGQRNSSAEKIAKHIFDKMAATYKHEIAKLVKVTVWETPDASASYYSEPLSA